MEFANRTETFPWRDWIERRNDICRKANKNFSECARLGAAFILDGLPSSWRPRQAPTRKGFRLRRRVYTKRRGFVRQKAAASRAKPRFLVKEKARAIALALRHCHKLATPLRFPGTYTPRLASYFRFLQYINPAAPRTSSAHVDGSGTALRSMDSLMILLLLPATSCKVIYPSL